MSNTTDLTVKQRLQRAVSKPLSSDWPTELHRDVLANIEQRESCAKLLKEQAKRLRGAVAAGFLQMPCTGTDVIDLEALAGDLEYAAMCSLGEDS